MIVMTLLVRNEEDIVRQNLEFHLAQGVDFVVAMDNLSTDGTVDILEEYRRQGVLELHRQTSEEFDQAEWVTGMARRAATEYGADWVINNDADEFWWPTHGTLASTLDALPDDVGTVEAERVNFVPTASDLPWLHALTVRETTSVNLDGTPLQAKTCHRGSPDVRVAAGNHYVSGVSFEPAPDGLILVLHYPLRSPAQFTRKISLGGAALIRNPRLSKTAAMHWRTLHQRWQDGTLDEWLDTQFLSPDDIEAGIGAGRLVTDRRLERWFASSGRAVTMPAPPPPPAPRGAGPAPPPPPAR